MKMTKTLALAALLAGGLFAGNALQAQDSSTAPPARQRGRGLNIDNLAKQLDLSDAQKPKVKAVLDEMQKKMRELRLDTSLSREDRRAKMKEIRDASSTKLKDILTADQFAKWEKMRPAGRRNGAGTPPPSGDTKPPQ